MRRRVPIAALVAAAAAVFAPAALAGPCGLPDSKPLWIDFGPPELAPILARPGTILAVSTGQHPANVRARGSKTVYWDMNLPGRVGTPAAPADPAVIDERAQRLFTAAASQTACETPWIALNELFGAHLETPWTPNNAQYRANVLAFVRALAARGARPFLLISSTPYIGSDEAVAWWRAVAEVSDIVPEVYPSARALWPLGPEVANRRLRASYRRAIARLVSIGVPLERIGIILGFQSAPGTGGRDGLKPRRAWLEMVKWKALSARHVAAEMRIPTVWSWGWGTYSEAGRDPDKPVAACVYLWARDRRLCNAPRMAGKAFNTSRTEGQLVLPSGAMCKIGRNTIRTSAIARLNVLVQDRDVAYTVLLSRLAESARVGVSTSEVLAVERAIIQHRFGGSVTGYRAALARGRASVAVARGILADTIRRRKLGSKLRVARPTPAAIAGFYAEYPDVLVRTVQAQGEAPWWLSGRTKGLALSTFAPAQLFALPAGRTATVRTLMGNYAVRALDEARPLGSVPLAQARPAIAAALTQFARSDAAVNVSASSQEAILRHAVCRRDDLPTVGVVDLTTYLPFLRLEG